MRCDKCKFRPAVICNYGSKGEETIHFHLCRHCTLETRHISDQLAHAQEIIANEENQMAAMEAAVRFAARDVDDAARQERVRQTGLIQDWYDKTITLRAPPEFGDKLGRRFSRKDAEERTPLEDIPPEGFVP